VRRLALRLAEEWEILSFLTGLIAVVVAVAEIWGGHWALLLGGVLLLVLPFIAAGRPT
jgi:hypothetical protein